MKYRKPEATVVYYDSPFSLSMAGSYENTNYGSMSDFVNHYFGTSQGVSNWYDGNSELFGCQVFHGVNGTYSFTVNGVVRTVTISFVSPKESEYGMDVWRCIGYGGGA